MEWRYILLNKFTRLLKEPLVHFLLIGASFFVIYGMWGQQETGEQDRTITITAGEINWLADAWQKRWNRPPTSEERQGIIDQYLREMILYREAVAMGLDKDDSVIRRRLSQKLEFLSQDLISPQPPTEKELKTYFEAHMDRYQAPDIITMTHVFIDPDLRGDQTIADAESIKAHLTELQEPPRDARSYGDPFMLQSYYPERSEAELLKLFGSGFARSVFELAPHQWNGPVLSGYGTHLVYVHDYQKAEPPSFADIEEQVREDWTHAKRTELNDQFVASVISRYKVTIEDGPVTENPLTSKEQVQ
jgi:peptidyl-prolyl cis-trans isomerase C